MPPKKKRNASQQLNQIQELDVVDIYTILVNESIKQSDLIQKLEESNSMNNFFLFYLKCVGFDQIVKKVEGVNVEDIKLEQYIQKLERLQQENDTSLVNEDACRMFSDKGSKQFIENVKLFFSTLFSSYTDLIFEEEKFFELSFSWLSSITQSRFRLVRVAGVELINIIVAQALNFLKDCQDQKKERDCMKFLNNLFDYFVTSRSRDIVPQIRRRICQVVFMAMECFSGDPYYDHLSTLFKSEYHECREQGLIEIERLPFKVVENYIKSEQEAFISVLFDTNESIQIRLIHYLLKFMQENKGYHENFFNKTSKAAIVRQLFCQNGRIRFEIAQIICYIDKSIERNLKGFIKFFIEHCPEGKIDFQECFQYVFSFLQKYEQLLNPHPYMTLFQEEQNEEIKKIILLFYASILEFSQIQNTKQYWWMDFEQQDTTIQSRFTTCFLELFHTLNLTIQDSNLIIGYLNVYLRLDYSQLMVIQFRNKFKYLLEQLLKTFQKSQEHSTIELISNIILKLQRNFDNDELFQLLLQDLARYLICLFDQEFTPLGLFKLENILKNGIIKLNKLLNDQKIEQLQLMVKMDNQNEISHSILKLFSAMFQNSLRQLFQYFKQQYQQQQQQQQFEDKQYRQMRDLFFNHAFNFIEQSQSSYTYEVLSLIINNLIYSNGQKLFKMGYAYNLSETQLQIMHAHLLKILFSDLQQKNEERNSTKKITTLEDLPQLNKFQMSLLISTITLLHQSQHILCTVNFGVKCFCQFVHISIQNPHLNVIIMGRLSESIRQLLEPDSKNKEFWQFITDYVVVIDGNRTFDYEQHHSEVVKVLVSAYLQVVSRCQSVQSMRERFISFCAQSIERVYHDRSFTPFLSVLSWIFHKPQKLIKQLQIDRLTYKKFSAFFEMSSKEFHRQEQPREYSASVERREGPLKTKLRAQTGISTQEIHRILNQMKPSAQKSEEEMEIPFEKEQKA